MSKLISNELFKLKRLKSVYTIFILSFLPYVINTIGLLTMRDDTESDKYYFFVFNQYSILFPTILFIFIGFIFYTEFKNRTMLNWIAYPHHNFNLIASKMSATFILLFFISVMNHVIHLGTMWAVYPDTIQFADISALFLTSLLFSTLSLLIIPVAALLAMITKNVIGVMIAGVASIFITTILLGADFSIYFPFSYIYRSSIQFFDSDFAYTSLQLQTWGGIIFAAYVGLSIAGLYLYAQRPRLY